MDAPPIVIDPAPWGSPLSRVGNPHRTDRDDPAPVHELVVERFAAHWVGVLGPQTLHSVMIHAGRAQARRGLGSEAVAVAVYHLRDVSGVPIVAMAEVFGMSVSWVDEKARLGCRLAGGPARRPGRPATVRRERLAGVSR